LIFIVHGLTIHAAPLHEVKSSHLLKRCLGGGYGDCIEGDRCEDGYDCEKHLVCYEGYCKKPKASESIDDNSEFIEDNSEFIDDNSEFIDDNSEFKDNDSEFKDNDSEFLDINSEFIDNDSEAIYDNLEFIYDKRS
ncbi:12932_t:CDS:2, partial [Cetraspora pellucida]